MLGLFLCFDHLLIGGLILERRLNNNYGRKVACEKSLLVALHLHHSMLTFSPEEQEDIVVVNLGEF